MKSPFGRRQKSLAERGEDAAAKHLQKHGFKILSRNLWMSGNEIDIVAQQKDVVAFVEVKTRMSDDAADPAESVGYEKQRKIIHAGNAYIAQRDDPNLYYRFDIITIVWPEGSIPKITWYEDAFRDDR